MAKAKRGILLSGSGTNFQAIIDRIESGKLNAEITVVISSKQDAFGLKRAKKHHLPAIWVNRQDYEENKEYNLAILDILKKYQVELVVLAGYMRLVDRV